MQLLFLCFTRRNYYAGKDWTRIFNKYLLSIIKWMKKFENKQKVVSEWRKLLLMPRAEYIHKFMFCFFSFFLTVISEVRNYSLRLLSPPVRPLFGIRPRYLAVSTGQWIFIWGIFLASCFIPKILLDKWRKERHVIIQKTSRVTWRTYAQISCEVI